MSILSSAEYVWSGAGPLGGNRVLAGEEKLGIGSRPCSSRMPVSGSSAPVRLCIRSVSADSKLRWFNHTPSFCPNC